MRDLWHRLETYLRKQAPAVLNFLNPPATEQQIRAAETEMGVQFPADFAASLRIHNGQPEWSRDSVPLVPNEFEEGGVYKAPFGELAPLATIVETTISFRAAIDDHLRNWASGFEYEGPVRRDGEWSWIVFVDAGSGNQLALDLNPAMGGQVGQVLSVNHDPPYLGVLAASFRDWFATLVQRYESGRYCFVEQDGLDAVDIFDPWTSRPDDDVQDHGILRFPK